MTEVGESEAAKRLRARAEARRARLIANEKSRMEKVGGPQSTTNTTTNTTDAISPDVLINPNQEPLVDSLPDLAQLRNLFSNAGLKPPIKENSSMIKQWGMFICGILSVCISVYLGRKETDEFGAPIVFYKGSTFMTLGFYAAAIVFRLFELTKASKFDPILLLSFFGIVRTCYPSYTVPVGLGIVAVIGGSHAAAQPTPQQLMGYAMELVNGLSAVKNYWVDYAVFAVANSLAVLAVAALMRFSFF